jgi:hypothetical protein
MTERRIAATAAVDRLVAIATATAALPRQTAVVRILTSLTWLALLLREWPNRAATWGPDAPWSLPLARAQLRLDGAFSLLVVHPGRLWFEACYLAALLVGVLMLLGWHTRVVSVLFLLGVASFHNRSLFISDSGDLVLQLTATYLVLMRCGQVWSWDARRERAGRRRRSAAHRADPLLWLAVGAALVAVLTTVEAEPVLPAIALAGWAAVGVQWAVRRRGSRPLRRTVEHLANLLHNAGVGLLMAQVVLIYSTAGWYKVQGRLWEQGTAVYYPLHIDSLTPWPALSHTLAASGLLVLVISYLTVMLQVAFPFAMLNRRAKKVLLVLLAGEHLGIAVLLGLPFFSAGMLAADAIYLPTSWLLAWSGRTTGQPAAPGGQFGLVPVGLVPVGLQFGAVTDGQPVGPFGPP